MKQEDTSPLSNILHEHHQLPLYWLADDWGHWGDEKAILRELKWAILWNDVVFIPDDFVLTNRYLRNFFDPYYQESQQVTNLFLDGTLRIVVRNVHTGYNNSISSFSDVTTAITSDPNFVWPVNAPSPEYIDYIDTVSKSSLSRPIGIDVDNRFRKKLLSISGAGGPSVSHEYYKQLFLSEAHSKQLPELSVDAALDAIQALANSSHPRRSLLYRISSGETNLDVMERNIHTDLSQFPNSIRAIGNDVFLHNLMENFLPIAMFPQGIPTPIWLDAAEQIVSGGNPLQNVRTDYIQVLPYFTGVVINNVHLLSFEQIISLRERSSGKEYRRAVAQSLSTVDATDTSITQILFQACAAYLTDIADVMGISVRSAALDRYILKWDIYSPVTSMTRISIGLVIQSLEALSKVIRLFSTTLSDEVARDIDRYVGKIVFDQELRKLGSYPKLVSTHQHLVTQDSSDT